MSISQLIVDKVNFYKWVLRIFSNFSNYLCLTIFIDVYSNYCVRYTNVFNGGCHIFFSMIAASLAMEEECRDILTSDFVFSNRLHIIFLLLMLIKCKNASDYQNDDDNRTYPICFFLHSNPLSKIYL